MQVEMSELERIRARYRENARLLATLERYLPFWSQTLSPKEQAAYDPPSNRTPSPPRGLLKDISQEEAVAFVPKVLKFTIKTKMD